MLTCLAALGRIDAYLPLNAALRLAERKVGESADRLLNLAYLDFVLAFCAAQRLR